MWIPRAEQIHQMEAVAATALYDDLNRERRTRGLAALQLDSRLDDAAVQHVVDMSVHNFFDHVSLNGESPFERMRDAGCAYSYAGENLAEAPTEQVADDALFASLPHRRNTLSAMYRRVGIAVMVSSDGRLLFVEDFSD